VKLFTLRTDSAAGQTEGWNVWPDIFRAGQFITAVDYLRFQRLRRQLMTDMESLMQEVDLLCDASDLVVTNLTGHPSVAPLVKDDRSR
jgi:hypothetical protein